MGGSAHGQHDESVQNQRHRRTLARLTRGGQGRFVCCLVTGPLRRLERLGSSRAGGAWLYLLLGFLTVHYQVSAKGTMKAPRTSGLYCLPESLLARKPRSEERGLVVQIKVRCRRCSMSRIELNGMSAASGAPRLPRTLRNGNLEVPAMWPLALTLSSLGELGS